MGNHSRESSNLTRNGPTCMCPPGPLFLCRPRNCQQRRHRYAVGITLSHEWYALHIHTATVTSYLTLVASSHFIIHPIGYHLHTYLDYVAMYFSAYPLILISVTPLLTYQKAERREIPPFRALYTHTGTHTHTYSHSHVFLCM